MNTLFYSMRYILSILSVLLCLYSCRTNNITLQTYKDIDSSTGNYTGNWQYSRHTWQNNIRVTKIDTSYTDVITVSKISPDSLIISSTLGAYRFKFDVLSNSYSNSTLVDSTIIEYSINVVAHTISAAGHSTYWNSTGNSDTITYKFSGKR